MGKNYNISLDIGTNSVGWAVDDDNFKLKKFKNRNMWGGVLFDEGKTAETRRINRTSRRRLDRRKKRIFYLQDLMSDIVLAKDETFYLRLKESYLHKEDRTNKKQASNLFIGKEFNDKEYYKRYHTIYHLRKELLETNEKMDIRLVYLAIHHIIKYRGNFLYEGQNIKNITGNIDGVFEHLRDLLSEYDIINLNLEITKIKSIISDDMLSRKKKVEELVKLSQIKEKTFKNIITQVYTAIVGLSFDVSKIFIDEDFGDIKKIKFTDDEVDEKLADIEGIIQERFEIIECMQKIYNWSEFQNILKDKDNISEAMVERYKKYKYDLDLLKKIIIDNCDRNIYVKLFKSFEIGGNYYSYEKNKYKKKGSKTVKDLFYNDIKKILDSIDIGEKYYEDKNYILSEIEKETFLNKNNIKENASIPYQLNLNELEIILQKQGQYYPLLKEASDKIIKLLTFRIPYYVGPLIDGMDKSQFAWMVKKANSKDKKIYPWNFEETVDINFSAEKFIRKMTNKCTYLPEEDVIPKYSLLYSDYMFYNEINRVRINGKLMDTEIKEKIKKDLFLKKNIVKENDIKKWCENNLQYGVTEYKIDGLQGNKAALVTLKSYRDFIRIFGEINNKNKEMIEKFIYWLTIFEDKRIVGNKIEEEYVKKQLITPDQKQKILRLNYSGWSRLSKKLLNGLYIVDSYQQKITILSKLKTTNMNFMQIISDKQLGFDKEIQKNIMEEDIVKFSYDELVKDLQGSPAIKRGIWQSLKVIQEIIKIMGHAPQNIFIEFARSDDKSSRSIPRKSKIQKIYEEIDEFGEVYKDLKAFKESSLTEKQYLYFLQQGKCMYTMEDLELDKLMMYEVDHIIPQCYVKDNGIDNKVLVKKKRNQDKSGEFLPVNVLPQDKKQRIKRWWNQLYKNKLISLRKYNNLSCETDFTRGEKIGFINRQLVETRQISRHVTNLINKCYEKEGVRVVAIKAGLVNDFKKAFDIYKVREINDYHHAKDAFLTGVVGSYILKRYEMFEAEFIYNKYMKYEKLNKRENRYGFIIGSMRNDYTDRDNLFSWKVNEQIQNIKKQLNYKDCNITKKISKNKGQMYQKTINPKLKNIKKINDVIPLKNGLDPMKYGYYTGEEIAYCVLIQYLNKNALVKQLVGIPIRKDLVIKESKDKLMEYLMEKIGIKDLIILKDKIYKYQLFKTEKGIFYLVSPTEWHNAKQLLIDIKYEKFLYLVNNNLKSLDEEVVSKELDTFFKYLVDKIEKHYVIYQRAIDKVKNGEEKYINLSVKDKIKVINEILKLTNVKGEYPSLPQIVATKDRLGRLNGRGNKFEDITFLNYSITGLFLKEERF